VVFIGERPEPASYKNYWEDAPKAEVKKEEEKEGASEEKKKDEEKPQILLDEKYKYLDDFGETLVGKKRPAILVFDIKENIIDEV
jgi:hypothetical protein